MVFGKLQEIRISNTDIVRIFSIADETTKIINEIPNQTSSTEVKDIA